jgi:hypothetical protein
MNTRPDRRRCAYGLLALAVAVILLGTLLPDERAGQIEWAQVFCVLCGRAALADGLANLVLFVPLGFALGLLRHPPRRALALATGLSVAVELAQFAIPGRDPSLSDVIFNTLGAATGVGLASLAARWRYPSAAQASRLSLLAALGAASVFVATDVLLTPSVPETTYFGGSAHVQSSDRPLRLGGNIEPQGYFRGRIDDVRIYRSARTAADIRADMNTPVTAAVRSPELVAAYNFDDASRPELADLSGQGNTGQIRGTTWTSQGRFGGALMFDGVGDVVVIPHRPALDLTEALTLEAWIYPTAAQRGWRAIVQKEFDTYFLLASSRAGALRPAGGATFGASTEPMSNPVSVPVDTWTHVAVTYDGAVLSLYVNGGLVSRRLRWYPGPISAATLGGLTIPASISRESPQLRARLVAGDALRVHTVAVAPVSALAPLVTLHDAERHEILLLAARGEDLLFRVRTRAAAANLDSPAILAPGALTGLRPGEGLTIAVSRVGRRYCVEANSRSTCGLGFTLGMGWAFLAYTQMPPGWIPAALNLAWMAVIVLPVGFWLRRRWESFLGIAIILAAAALVCVVGSLTIPPQEAAVAILALLLGRASAWLWRRTNLLKSTTQQLR